MSTESYVLVLVNLNLISARDPLLMNVYPWATALARQYNDTIVHARVM